MMTPPAASSTLSIQRVTPFAQRVSAIPQDTLAASFISLGNAVFLGCLLLTFMIPAAPLGILHYVQQDTGWSRETLLLVFIGLFFMDVSQGKRTLTPTWSYLTTLSGHCILACLALGYFIQGRMSLIGLTTHAGSFVLALAMIGVFAQRIRPMRYIPSLNRFLLPIISTLLFLISAGLIIQQDGALRLFIEDRYGIPALVIIVAFLWWGAGQLRHNHMPPWYALRRMVGMFFFALMTLYLLTYGEGVSFFGVFMTLYLSGLMVIVAFIQSKEWAG